MSSVSVSRYPVIDKKAKYKPADAGFDFYLLMPNGFTPPAAYMQHRLLCGLINNSPARHIVNDACRRAELTCEFTAI